MAISTQIQNVNIHVGDTVDVHYRIIEKEVVSGKTKKEKHEQQKERLQVFGGVIIAIHCRHENQSFLVRHIGVGKIGVERIFPIVSPWIKKVVVKKKGLVRRAKLYYLRDKSKKEIARITAHNASKTAKDKKEATVVSPTDKETKPVTQSTPVVG